MRSWGGDYLYAHKGYARGKTTIVYRDRSHVRDYFYVGDVVRVIKMIVNGKPKPETLGVERAFTSGSPLYSVA